jgi:diadenosine tetraphosphatase ApaH/serine/threonine PP2A family protein phosphatase
MRYAILSDVHGNLEALRAVLQDIYTVNRQVGVRVAQIWCLGDSVGYGPEPGECVEQVSRRCDICVAGNHDWAAIKKIDLADFSEAAANSATWTREHLTTVGFNYLKSLRETTHIGHFTLSHGSPYDPIWEYLTTPDAAANSFQYFDTLYCVVGHTHLPTIFLQPIVDHMAPVRAAARNLNRKVALTMAIAGGPTRSSLEADEYSTASRIPATVPCERWQPTPGVWRIPPNHRAIINPGSVGQPRDGDPRASYVIYDSEQGFEFRRVHYNIAATQHKIMALGLPERLAERLATAN